MLQRLRAEGLALLYISHRMHEIDALADDCSVFRNGRNVATFDAGPAQRRRGRRADDRPRHPATSSRRSRRAGAAARRVLDVRGPQLGDRLRDISFDVGAGEVVGLGGLDGQGQRELLLALFGVLRGVTGEIADRRPAGRAASPRAAKSPAIGMALIPEDRKTEGLMLPMSVARQPLASPRSIASAASASSTAARERAADRRR